MIDNKSRANNMCEEIRNIIKSAIMVTELKTNFIENGPFRIRIDYTGLAKEIVFLKFMNITEECDKHSLKMTELEIQRVLQKIKFQMFRSIKKNIDSQISIAYISNLEIADDIFLGYIELNLYQSSEEIFSESSSRDIQLKGHISEPSDEKFEAKITRKPKS